MATPRAGKIEVMAADPTDPEAATSEADVITYVWRVWRDTQAGTSPELEDVVVKTVALVAGEEGVSARVEWVSPLETGQPLHVTGRRIARGKGERPREIGDDVVWAVWAEAHGTS
jgi:hypothetical protein